ncbi:hypothetical protein MUO66_02225 [Candidatus Bathyarchaeota archaeon]|nr:hypothetical protein [Candidatus Bathyarchaeota archaeon]
MGTEIRTFNSIKELSEYTTKKLGKYKSLHEDYGQWLGTLLRSFEETHKNEEWYKNSTAIQKTLNSKKKKSPEKSKKGKRKNSSRSVWVESDNVMISSIEEGQTEILFEALEKINQKIQEIEKIKNTTQQLERMGLGKTMSYIIYIENEIPRKIFLRPKGNLPEDKSFEFATELSIPALHSYFEPK